MGIDPDRDLRLALPRMRRIHLAAHADGVTVASAACQQSHEKNPRPPHPGEHTPDDVAGKALLSWRHHISMSSSEMGAPAPLFFEKTWPKRTVTGRSANCRHRSPRRWS